MDHMGFVRNSVFDTIVPQRSEIDLEEALKTTDIRDPTSDACLVPSIAQRQLLFFGTSKETLYPEVQILTHSRFIDESVDIYVVLRTPFREEQALRSYISRLTIRLEVHAISHQAHLKQDGQATHVGDLIFSSDVKETEDPLIVLQDSDEASDEEDGRHVYLFWKLSVFLSMRSSSVRMNSTNIEYKTIHECAYHLPALHSPFFLAYVQLRISKDVRRNQNIFPMLRQRNSTSLSRYRAILDMAKSSHSYPPRGCLDLHLLRPPLRKAYNLYRRTPNATSGRLMLPALDYVIQGSRATTSNQAS